MSGSPERSERVRAIAERLARAGETRVPIDPPTATEPSLTIADAYGVQMVNVERRLAQGRKIVGCKVGLTSAAMQRMLGVNEPDFGHLFDDMLMRNGGECAMNALIQPRVEPEIAFVLSRELRGPGVTRDEVMEATSYVTPALEIIDTRIKDWKIALADTIADNASSARVVLGDRMSPADAYDLRLVGVVLDRNGEVLETGAGAAALGHPAQAVAWLVNKLASFGQSVAEGSVVMPGSLTRAVDVKRGDAVTAQFDRLGSVSVRFV